MTTRSTHRSASARASCEVLVRGDRQHVAISDDLKDYICDGYQPRDMDNAAIRQWIGELTLSMRPSSRADARITMHRLIPFGQFLLARGFDLGNDIADMFSDDLIALFVTERYEPGTAQTVASLLRRVRRTSTGERKVVLHRTSIDRVVGPATRTEMARFREWIMGFSRDSLTRRDGLMILSLVRGAGCTKRDLGHVLTAGWEHRAGGKILVTLPTVGSQARAVVVNREWARPLLAAAESCAGRSPFDTAATGRDGRQALKSLENRYYRQRLSNPAGAPAGFINVDAYRAAWLVDRLASGVRLDHLLDEAGLASAAALDRYLQFLPNTSRPHISGLGDR